MVAQSSTGKVDNTDAKAVKRAVADLVKVKKENDGEFNTSTVIKGLIGEEIDSTFGKEESDIVRVLTNGDAAMKAINATAKMAEATLKVTDSLFKNPNEKESKKYTTYREGVIELTKVTNTVIKGQIAAAQLVLRLARTAYIKAAK